MNAAKTAASTQSLAALLLSGWASELDHLDTDAQAAALDRFEHLASCDEDEISAAADFIALAL